MDIIKTWVLIFEKVSKLFILNSLAWDPSWKTWTGGSNSYWIECQQNSTHFYFKESDKWVQNWPSRFFGNKNTGKWEECHPFCTECYGSMSTECTSWDISNRYIYVFPDTWAYLDCPSQTYYNQTTKSWENWDNSCKTCDGPLSSNWLSWSYSKFYNSSDNSCKECKHYFSS